MPRIGRRASATEEGQLLELIGDVCGLLDIDELRHGMLRALERALPSDYMSLNDVTPEPRHIVTLIEPETSTEMLATWMQLAHENPLLHYYQRTLDGRANRFSDVIAADSLHRLPLYRRLYRPMGVEHQMAFTLPASPDRVLAIALSRGARDYTDQERDFANRARPFLIQAYLNAIAFSALSCGESNAALVDEGAGEHSGERRGESLLGALRSAGLTRREAEVLRLVAFGSSNHHIAADLGISYRTVGKHLEHSFRKLAVGDRSTAAARAWTLADADADADVDAHADASTGVINGAVGRANCSGLGRAIQ